MDQHAGLAGRGCEVQRDGTPRRWENVLTLALSVARANQHTRRRLTTALVWALTGAGYHPEPNPPPTGSRQPQVTVLLNTTITVDVDVANKPTVDAEGPHQALPASLPAGQSVGPPGLCVACHRAGSQRARRATGRRWPWPPHRARADLPAGAQRVKNRLRGGPAAGMALSSHRNGRDCAAAAGCMPEPCGADRPAGCHIPSHY